MKQIQKVTEVKKGSKWEVHHTSTDEKTVYEDLAKALVSKKLHKCLYIKSIKDRCNYDGTRTITVNYDNGVRCIFNIES